MFTQDNHEPPCTKKQYVLNSPKHEGGRIKYMSTKIWPQSRCEQARDDKLIEKDRKKKSLISLTIVVLFHAQHIPVSWLSSYARNMTVAT